MGEGAATALSSCRPYPAGSPSLCCGERRPRGDPEDLLGSSRLPGCPLRTAPCWGSSLATKHQPSCTAPAVDSEASRGRPGGTFPPPQLAGRLWAPPELPSHPFQPAPGSSAGSPGSTQTSGPGLSLGLGCPGGLENGGPCGRPALLLRGPRGAGGHGGSLGPWGQPLTSLLASVGQGRWLGAAGLSHHPRGLLLRLWVVEGDCRGSGAPHTRACHTTPPRDS